jgi:hypothetical protein
LIRWANFVWKTAPLLLAVWLLATYALSDRSKSGGSPGVRVRATLVNVGQSFRRDRLRYAARGTADVEHPVALNCTIAAVGEANEPVAADSFTLIGIQGAFAHSGTLAPTEFGKTVAMGNGARVLTRAELSARCEAVGS